MVRRGGEVAEVVGREVVPCEVKRTRTFRGGAAAGDHARGGLEFEAFRGSPLLEGSNARGAGNVRGGPGGGVEVEVADEDGGNVGGREKRRRAWRAEGSSTSL